VVQEVPRDYAVFMREYLAGANRIYTYFLARTIAEIPFQVRAVLTGSAGHQQLRLIQPDIVTTELLVGLGSMGPVFW
jgi:hypothetical protein